MVGELHQNLTAEQRDQFQSWLDKAQSDAGAGATALQRLLPELLRVAGTDELQTRPPSSPLQWSDELHVPVEQRQADMECATLMLGMHMVHRPAPSP